MGDLKDMQGFDPNQSLAMDHTIDMGQSPMGEIPNYDEPSRQRFEQNNDFGRAGGMQRSNSLSGNQDRPQQDNMMAQSNQFQRHQTMVPQHQNNQMQNQN